MANTKIQNLTAKTTPVNADTVPVYDSEDATTYTKQVTMTNLKAFLKTYFDTIYGTPVAGEALGGSGTARTLSNTPISGTLKIYDGSARLFGGGVDYTQTGTAVTFNVAPDNPYADYRYA